jgi:hypothetical protein
MTNGKEILKEKNLTVEGIAELRYKTPSMSGEYF